MPKGRPKLKYLREQEQHRRHEQEVSQLRHASAENAHLAQHQPPKAYTHKGMEKSWPPMDDSIAINLKHAGTAFHGSLTYNLLCMSSDIPKGKLVFTVFGKLGTKTDQTLGTFEINTQAKIVKPHKG